MKAFLDVNIFMYAAGRPHAHREPSLQLLKGVADGELDAVSDAEVLQEILYRFGHLKMLSHGMELLTQAVQVVPEWLAVSRDDVVLAKDLLGRHGHLSPRDAIHAAVMLHHGVTRIYSYDRHFDAVEGLQRVEP